MLIDDLLSDAQLFVERHVEIYHNLLPDEQVIEHFWNYVQHDADLSPEMLAGLWLDDQTFGKVTSDCGTLRYPNVEHILRSNASARLHAYMMSYRDTLL